MVTHPPTRPNRRAFTLIELLVVVSIIVVLIAILVPSLAIAKEKAKLTICQTHVRAWAQGFHVYATANSSMLPLDGAANNEKVSSPVGVWNDLELWFNAIPSVNDNATYDDFQHQQPGFVTNSNEAPHKGLPISGTNSLFVCPSAINVAGGHDTPTPDTVINGYFQTYGYEVSTVGTFSPTVRDMFLCYGMNSQLRDWQYGTSARNYPGQPTPGTSDDIKTLTMIDAPASVVLIAEKRVNPAELNPIPDINLDGNASDAASIRSQNLTQTKVAPKRFTARHSLGGNIGFADGHVEWFTYQAVNKADNATPQYNQIGVLVWNPLD